MSWAGIDGRGLTLPQLDAWIKSLPASTWASGMVLHNTAAPNLSQWTPTNAAQRIKNLEVYFRDDRGWPSAPHAFVADDLVWLFTPFTKKGTHSPSWNGTKLGIEMVGDFDKDDPTTGRGLNVVKNTVALFGMLHSKYGWDPETIKLHKEDPRTTHDCPGKLISKSHFINAVLEYMGHAGGHGDPPPITKHIMIVAVASDDTLNLRNKSSSSGLVLAALRPGTEVEVLSEAMNGKTKWLRVNAVGKTGWVAAAYVKEKA